MAEAVRWPTKETALDAFERESPAAAASLSEHDLVASARVAGAVHEARTAGVPDLNAPAPGTMTRVSAPGARRVREWCATARHSVAAAGASATKIFQRCVANLGASEHARWLPAWHRLGRRWAVPALVLIVLIQSVWLVKDELGNDRAGTADPAPTVNAVSDRSTRATSGSRPAGTAQRADEVVTWQAAIGQRSVTPDNSAAAKRLAPAAVTAAKPVAAPGSVSISVPFQVELYENGRFVGINGENGVPLAPGSHRLELVNESLRYRSSHTVAITSGRSTLMNVTLPTGKLHLNAVPWAEVLIDGNSVGETPLGNVEVPIGSHRITFRHPQLGEQTRNVVVVAESLTRIGVDLQK